MNTDSQLKLAGEEDQAGGCLDPFFYSEVDSVATEVSRRTWFHIMFFTFWATVQSICFTIKVYGSYRYWYAFFVPTYVAIACYPVYLLLMIRPPALLGSRKYMLLVLGWCVSLVTVVLLVVHLDAAYTMSLRSFWLGETIMIGILLIFAVLALLFTARVDRRRQVEVINSGLVGDDSTL